MHPSAGHNTTPKPNIHNNVMEITSRVHMPTSTAADAVTLEKADQSLVNHDSDPDVMESNHDLPARTMTEENTNEQTQSEKDDPATTAAREELRHTSISDRITPTSRVDPPNTEAEPEAEDKPMRERASTPNAEPSDAQDEEMRERLSSPKKKRGRDQDDDTGRELDDGDADKQGSASDGSVLNGNRTIRSGPEKKRPRDTSEDGENSKSVEKATGEKVHCLGQPLNPHQS
jgi:phage terminase small subunit